MKFRLLFSAAWFFAIVGVSYCQPSQAGIKADLVAQIDAAGNKFAALAQAMSQEQYSWRPMDGVRSVSEVYMHVATSNYSFLRMMGVELPMKMEKGLEKSVTVKSEVLDWLKKSFAFTKESVNNMKDDDLGKATKLFGKDATYGAALATLVAHVHEHLGQSIAYARMNKVVPPWSM